MLRRKFEISMQNSIYRSTIIFLESSITDLMNFTRITTDVRLIEISKRFVCACVYFEIISHNFPSAIDTLVAGINFELIFSFSIAIYSLENFDDYFALFMQTDFDLKF